MKPAGGLNIEVEGVDRKPPVDRQVGAKRYCWFLAAMVVSLIFAPLLLVRSDFYIHRSPDFWDGVLNYSFLLRRQVNDIVIFGDSSAAHGVDPRVVQRLLGLRVVNLPATRATLATGELPLDHYLNNNPRPKALVLYVTPWDTATHVSAEIQYEALVTLVRHGSLTSVIKQFLTNPTSMEQFDHRVMRNLASILLSHNKMAVQYEHEVQAGQGYIHPSIQVPLMNRRSCDVKHRSFSDQGYLIHFVQKYRRLGLRVIVFIAPIPDCNPSFRAYRDSLRAVADHEVFTLPQSWFADDARFVHPLPIAVPIISRILAETIRAGLQLSAP